MGKKLFVGNLPFSTTNQQLNDLFSRAGTVESASVITDRATGQSRGFGFVEMSTAEEAQQAIATLNDQPFEGRKLTVNVANSPGSGGGSRSGGGPRRSPRW